MAFHRDEKYAAHDDKVFGEYLTTYTSATGQVRAYLFEQYGKVVAHVTFPTGLWASRVTDRYVTDLWEFARQQGFEERFELILS